MINTLNEKPLHEALKSWYAQPGDSLEEPVDGFIIDIVRGDLLVEIQTRNFKAIKPKIEKLLVHHSVRLVYPIPQEKWIIKLGDNARPISRRKSPKQGSYEQVFDELISLPELLLLPNLSLELLLIQEEEVRCYDGRRGWRRGGWVIQERRLIQVLDRQVCRSPADMLTFIPSTAADPFTTTDLASALGKTLRLAQKMAYCLRRMGCLHPVGKRSKSILYAKTGVK